MTHGIEFKNNAGKTLIGTSVNMLNFQRKITGNISDNATVVNLATGVTNQNTPPVIYYVPQNSTQAGNLYVLANLFYANGQWRVGFWGRAGINIEAYVFLAGTGTNSGWGINIYNAQGGFAFSSASRPLVALAAIQINRSSDVFTSTGGGIITSEWALGGATVNLPAQAQNKKIAISTTPFFAGVYRAIDRPQFEGGDTLDFAAGGIRKNGNQLIAESSVLYSQNIGGGSWIASPYWQSNITCVIDAGVYDG